MMKTKITYISIIVLLIGVIIYLLTQGNTQEERVEIKTTIEKIPVKVETPVYVPKWRTKVETITEFQFETDTFQAPVDTNEILKVYFAKVQRKEVLTLPNKQGTVTIIDTISKNNIVNRKFIADVKRMIVNDTIYTQIPRKTEAYLGIDAKFDKPNVVNIIGLSMLFKNKDDNHMYKLGVGVTNRVDDGGTNGKLVPFIGGGVYWKIKLKKD